MLLAGQIGLAAQQVEYSLFTIGSLFAHSSLTIESGGVLAMGSAKEVESGGWIWNRPSITPIVSGY